MRLDISGKGSKRTIIEVAVIERSDNQLTVWTNDGSYCTFALSSTERADEVMTDLYHKGHAAIYADINWDSAFDEEDPTK